MKRRYFPASINVKDRRCLVIGCDAEAVEKSVRLLESGAIVDIISHGPATGLAAAVDAGAHVMERQFMPGDIVDQFMVVLAIKTDPALTRLVHARCAERRVLFSAIDQPDFTDIAHVSLIEAGPLKITVSSDGRAPALARRIREDFQATFEKYPVEDFLNHLSELRTRLEHEVPDLAERRRLLIAAVKDFRLDIAVKFPEEWRKVPE